VNLDDVREILALMRENGLSEFEIEREGLKLRLRKDAGGPGGAASPAGGTAPPPFAQGGVPPSAIVGSAPAGAEAQPPEAASEVEIELAVVKSPIVGTFYRSSEPGSASFVEIGATVKKGQVLCIIEAMKLMNEIDSEYDGEIVNIYVESGQPVQYGERLFAIRTT
jgi:acetyl-CoA carboxylase biotin carboxyl carrier protein